MDRQTDIACLTLSHIHNCFTSYSFLFLFAGFIGTLSRSFVGTVHAHATYIIKMHHLFERAVTTFLGARYDGGQRRHFRRVHECGMIDISLRRYSH